MIMPKTSGLNHLDLRARDENDPRAPLLLFLNT